MGSQSVSDEIKLTLQNTDLRQEVRETPGERYSNYWHVMIAARHI